MERETTQQPRGFVILKKSKGRVRQLHFVGACHLAPGIDYLDFEVWGEVMPASEDLTGLCPRCFRDQPQPHDIVWKREVEEAMASSASSAGDSEHDDDEA